MATIKDRLEAFIGRIRNPEDFPVKEPLFVGQWGYDPVSIVLALQKQSGTIVLFLFSWDSSHDEVSTDYSAEEFSTLKELFIQRPNLLDLVHMTPPKLPA